MKLGILFAFLIYYGLLTIFFFFASPYINVEGSNYTSTIDIGNLNMDYRTGYYNIDLFYTDFNWADGTYKWTTTPALIGWLLAINDETYCINDDNDDCFRSEKDNCQLYYNRDIDANGCQDKISITGFVNIENLNGTQNLNLMISDDSGDSYTNIYTISDGDFNGAWEYLANTNVYGVDSLRIGFNATGLDYEDNEHFYIDNIKVSCQVTQKYLEDNATEQTSVSIKSFFAFLGFGIGLPNDTPIWFQVIFSVWQGILLIMFLALLYQAIRGS